MYNYIKPIASLVKDKGGQRLPEPELDVVGFVAGFTPDNDDHTHAHAGNMPMMIVA